MKLNKNVSKGILTVFLIILLFYICLDSYYYLDNLYPSISTFKTNPEIYDGIKIEKVGRMKDIRNNTFTLRVGMNEVMVKADYSGIEPVKKGVVIVNGVYNKEGHIDMTNIHYSHYHDIKYLISLVGLIIVAIYFVREWRLTKRGFMSNA